MAKYELKTKKNDGDVIAFLNSVADENKRNESFIILEMMMKITKTEPKMWGSSIIGFGEYHYKYASGQEGDWFRIGLSPRKQNITIYLICGQNSNKDLLKKLGKFKSGKSCLYINKLEDINLSILKKLITNSYKR